MIVESDVMDDEANDLKSFTLVIDLNITDNQIDAFNNASHGAYLIRRNGVGANRGKVAVGEHLLLWKVWEEEVTDENLSPFISKQESEKFLLNLHQFCGCAGAPTIQTIEG